jgi:Phytanoyl-CoA dioxygenase (PhyH)
MKQYKKEYDKYGYIILKGVLNPSEVIETRQAVFNTFKKLRKHSGTQQSYDMDYLGINEILTHSQVVAKPQFSPQVIDAIKHIFGDYSYVNDLHVQRNTHLTDGVSGWHIDAGSNFALRYFNNKLGLNDYKFAKIGVYLQSKNCPIGGSINVIPKSHRFNKFFRSTLIRLFESKLNRSLSKISNKLNLENLFNPKKLDDVLTAGDCVIFDCRLLHRSSGRIANHISQDKENLDDKLVIYWEVGDSASVQKFLFNDLARSLFHENISRELKPEKPFSDYLCLKYPESYPQWYIDLCTTSKVDIATFKNNRHLVLAQIINR